MIGRAGECRLIYHSARCFSDGEAAAFAAGEALPLLFCRSSPRVGGRAALIYPQLRRACRPAEFIYGERATLLMLPADGYYRVPRMRP